MVQRGIAPSTDDIMAQLKTKFPNRRRKVRWPDKDRINELRNLVEKVVIPMDVDECEEEKESMAVNSGDLIWGSLRELRNSIENDFQAVEVHWEDIFMVASRAKK